MTTYRTAGGSGDVTTWWYDEATGLLTNKTYADNHGTAYTYTTGGRLATRTWARGITTTYNYDASGSLTNLNYSDGTPAVAFTFNRLGQQTVITDGTGARTNGYNTALQLTTEAASLAVLSRSYDALGRASGIALDSGYAAGYGYDAIGRFATVSNTMDVFTYGYVTNSSLLAGVTSVGGAFVAYSYDPYRNLKTQVLNKWGGNPVSQFDYVNDAIGRRTQRVDALAVTNNFGYNTRSELASAVMGTNTYGYVYDPIGNRLTATNNSEVLHYGANQLNQYTNITDGVTVTPLYDADGNLTNDGRFAYTWDAENRLIGAVTAIPAVTAGAPQQNLVFAYDSQSRRVSKVVSNWTGSSWGSAVTNTFIYDGWNLLQEVRNQPSGVSTNSYIWGLDLSQSLQGAGGIGGLLGAKLGATGTSVYYNYDANGNVTELVDTTGSIVGQYEYGPFGEVVKKTGAASGQPFRLSSKYQDDETGLLYYGYRYYDSTVGRWSNRDPLEEAGGLNTYALVSNNPLLFMDVNGAGPFWDYWKTVLLDNPTFFFSWVLGVGPKNIVYTENSTVQDKRLWDSLHSSQGFSDMVADYEKNFCPKAGNGGYGHFASYFENFKFVLLKFNPANFQIGGFSWTATPLPGAKARFVIANTASLGSFVGVTTLADTIGWSWLSWLKSSLGPNGISILGHYFVAPIQQTFVYEEKVCCSK